MSRLKCHPVYKTPDTILHLYSKICPKIIVFCKSILGKWFPVIVFSSSLFRLIVLRIKTLVSRTSSVVHWPNKKPCFQNVIIPCRVVLKVTVSVLYLIKVVSWSWCSFKKLQLSFPSCQHFVIFPVLIVLLRKKSKNGKTEFYPVPHLDNNVVHKIKKTMIGTIIGLIFPPFFHPKQF